MQTTDLSNGATQTNLFLPVGDYALRVRLLDSVNGRELLPAQETNIKVISADRI